MIVRYNTQDSEMAQFVYTMQQVGKVVPPKREILKDISLSFFPGAKIGVLGLNGAGKSTLLRIMAGVEWFANKSGVCSSNHFEVGGFIRSMNGIRHPDIQFHFLAGAVEEQSNFKNVHAFQVHCGTMRPYSRGYVKLDHKKELIIQPNYLEHELDLQDLRKSVKLTFEILSQEAFDKYRDSYIIPKSDNLTNKEIDNFIIRNVQSAYHPTSTCAIGKVVDENGGMHPSIGDADTRLLNRMRRSAVSAIYGAGMHPDRKLWVNNERTPIRTSFVPTNIYRPNAEKTF